jgi:hypothetical protein
VAPVEVERVGADHQELPDGIERRFRQRLAEAVEGRVHDRFHAGQLAEGDEQLVQRWVVVRADDLHADSAVGVAHAGQARVFRHRRRDHVRGETAERAGAQSELVHR